MRYFIDIAYKGTNFAGWQKQQNAHTIQAEIEQKLSWYFKQNIEIVGSGRTDAGVHAFQQIAHFDIEKQISKDDFLYRLNKMLSESIAIKDMYEVKSNAHARFDAVYRSYQYHILTKKSPFIKNDALYYPYKIDIEKMQEATKILLEHNDFQAFSKVHTEVNNFLCQIYKAEWEIQEDKIIFHIAANRFLRGMVRAIVGTLLAIAKNKITIEEFRDIFDSKNRQNAGESIDADGLYLSEVLYDKEII
ncbi:MAG: tRNA pseudouridine(38-40) synthase TruA [Bacteroidetes bacterium]|nr:MAG: tRNA pseudouridine(38-40) synthase TruA [Bacteroidota bacterium]TAG93355.1 MAG: tRNA pseudouridine(38-40) synthase TruA [Bacteroidota bacterium]